METLTLYESISMPMPIPPPSAGTRALRLPPLDIRSFLSASLRSLSAADLTRTFSRMRSALAGSTDVASPDEGWMSERWRETSRVSERAARAGLPAILKKKDRKPRLNKPDGSERRLSDNRTHRFLKKARSRRSLISVTRLIALIVVWTRSRSYRTGTLRRFWNSNVESFRRGRKRSCQSRYNTRQE